MRTAPFIQRVIILWTIFSVPALAGFAQQKPDEVVRGSPAPVPLERGRTVLFFIDDLHLSPASTTYTRRMLKQFIERMKQNDQAEIVSASGQLGFLQQLTDNRTVLNSAADRLRANQLT